MQCVHALVLFSVALDIHCSFITLAQHAPIHFCHFRDASTDVWIYFVALSGLSVVAVLLIVVASETNLAGSPTEMAATTLFLLTGIISSIILCTCIVLETCVLNSFNMDGVLFKRRFNL